MKHTPSDYRFMARAIQLAEKGLYSTQPNPRVGCVIVADKRVVGQGYHRQAGGPHAEIHALQQAGAAARGATAYVSLEPCSHQGKTPPCADALIEAGVGRVICAMLDPNPLVAGRGLEKLKLAGIETHCGLLQAEAEALNPGFIKRMKTGLPWVRLKLAMSLDGRTAMASGESKWITGEHARADVQKLRARSSVVLTGSGTVRADNPSMNVRISARELGTELAPFQPLRAVIDSELRIDANSQILQLPGECVVFCNTRTDASDFKDGQVIVSPEKDGKIDLRAVMQWLAARQANEVHVEAGSRLAGALLQQRLVDEIIIYMAPHIMGDAAMGLFHLPGLEKMSQRIDLEIQQIRPIGKDWRMRARPLYKN